jgi:hypothetical protein
MRTLWHAGKYLRKHWPIHGAVSARILGDALGILANAYNEVLRSTEYGLSRQQPV